MAARNEKIQSYTKFLTCAGKPPRIMDVDALALENCFEENYETPASDVIALVNIGNLIMNINIIQNGKPLFTRDVHVENTQIDPAIPRVEGIPALDTEGADTKILIANGGTVVIGGIITIVIAKHD